MYNSNSFQQTLKELEDELRNLKSPQGAIKNIPAYFYELISPQQFKYKITYADGDNDIITRMYTVGTSYVGHILTKPSNNTQYLLINDVGSQVDWDSILFESTREILSVQAV